jgi:hypothetical protein
MAKKRKKWLALQRARCLTLASLRHINELIEAARPDAGEKPPLDNYTIKLGGTWDAPGKSGMWFERYVTEALNEGIITAPELPAVEAADV